MKLHLKIYEIATTDLIFYIQPEVPEYGEYFIRNKGTKAEIQCKPNFVFTQDDIFTNKSKFFVKWIKIKNEKGR